MVALTKSVFDAGPSDLIKEVDVYNVVDSATRNAITSKLTAFGDGLSTVYSKSTEYIGDIAKKFKQGQVDLAEAQRRIQGALKGSRADITSLATSIQNTIFSDLTGLDSGTDYVRQASSLYNAVQVVTSKGTALIKDFKQGEISAAMRMMSDITGNSVFKALDIGAEAALVKGLLTEVSKWGVPTLVDEFLDKVDPDVRYSAVARSAASMASSSDIDTVEVMIKKVGANALTSQTPNFAVTLLSRYKFKEGTTAADYPVRLAQLVQVMNQLQANWFTTHRTYISDTTHQPVQEDLANLAVLAYASDDAVTLLSSDEQYLPYVITASLYPIKASKALLKSMYPYIAIK
jgi:hypothetical protein